MGIQGIQLEVGNGQVEGRRRAVVEELHKAEEEVGHRTDIGRDT